MKDVIKVFLSVVLFLIVAAMCYQGANKYRRDRQSAICQEIGKLYGLRATSIDNYHFSNASDCYLEYKGRMVESWYVEYVNTSGHE